LAYFGPPAEAIKFFAVDDFPDIYTRLSQTFTPSETKAVPDPLKSLYQQQLKQGGGPTEIPAGPLWAEYYRRSPLYKIFVSNRQTGEVARPITVAGSNITGHLGDQFRQFKVLSRRYFDLIRHDKMSLWVLLVVMPLIGLFLLLISQGAALVGHPPAEIATILETEGSYTIASEAQTLLFMIALATNLLGVFAASYELIKEDVIYRRERTINLRIAPYFASKFVILGAFLLVQCLLLLLVLTFKIRYPTQGVIFWAVLEYYFTLIFTALASVALGLFISALASTQNMVIYLVLLVLFIEIVFSGAIFELSPVTQPLSYLTITRWSVEALGLSTDINMLNDLGQVRLEREINFGRGQQKVVEDVVTPLDFQLDYTRNPLALTSRWLFLLLHTLVWSSLTVWLIKRKDEIK
jgi:hypothetical protein